MTSLKTVKLYRDVSGREPFTVWLQSFKDQVTKARLQQRIRRLEIGNYGERKLLKEGIWELKIDFGPGYRIYYGEEGDTVVILLCGGDKKTQPLDIKKAQSYWKEYKGR